MDICNRAKIIKKHNDELFLYKAHLIIPTIILIVINIFLIFNIINGFVNKNNIFNIYDNPLLYYAIVISLITLLKMYTIYNFKKICLYIIYIINGLIQLIITIWFIITFYISFLAPLIVSVVILLIFVCFSTLNILIIVYYYKLRNLFKY